MDKETCPICDRELGSINIDHHHLMPKCRGGRERFLVHRVCHRKIHATFTEKELEKHYHTWEELRAHPDIAAFIVWVQRKTPDFYGRSVSAKRKGSGPNLF